MGVFFVLAQFILVSSLFRVSGFEFRVLSFESERVTRASEMVTRASEMVTRASEMQGRASEMQGRASERQGRASDRTQEALSVSGCGSVYRTVSNIFFRREELYLPIKIFTDSWTRVARHVATCLPLTYCWGISFLCG